ncbi:MAG: sigma-54-dependent Fis family transcriptional regulator [Bdellovibrionaceae bacterium]|nr:sigma-54-dependent Fis family transcriptional regulator [Pseudobdellovibrionaceae bacterium]
MTEKPKVLFVDDQWEDVYHHIIYLRAHGFEVEVVDSGEKAINLVRPSASDFGVIFLDYRMRGLDGGQTLVRLKELNPRAQVFFLSSDQTREAIKVAMRGGAKDFIDKSASREEVLQIARKWIVLYENESRSVEGSGGSADNREAISQIGMVGESPALAAVAHKVGLYRQTREPVLIVGERGTGKELIARALHQGSGQFLAVNCAGFQNSTDLMRKALFGVKKGSYTGAVKDEPGIFRAAGRGTVFLDELHTLSPAAQAVLLRALQEHTVRPVEDEREYPFFCRVVAATQPGIYQMMERGFFSPDLYDRIRVGLIEVPTLANRREDILPLVLHVARRFAEDHQRDQKKFVASTIRYLEHYAWPGNVRELQSEIKRLCIEVTSDTILPEHLPSKFFADVEAAERRPSLRKAPRSRKQIIEHYLIELGYSERATAAALKVPYTSFRRELKRLGIQHAGKRKA